jgi:hypothetical protein
MRTRSGGGCICFKDEIATGCVSLVRENFWCSMVASPVSQGSSNIRNRGEGESVSETSTLTVSVVGGIEPSWTSSEFGVGRFLL